MKEGYLKKFYTVIIVAMLIMALTISLTLYKDKKAIVNNPQFETNGVEGLDDLIEDNKPSEDDNSNTNNNPPSSTPTNKTYGANQGWDLYLDAMTIYYNSIGVKTTATTYCTANILGIKETQTVIEKMIYSGNYYLKHSIGYCTTSLGEFFSKYTYSSDGQNYRHRETNKLSNNNTTPDWSGTYMDVTVTKDRISEVEQYPFDAFTYLPSAKSELTNFDRMSSSKYYILSFRKDVNTIPDNYEEFIKRNGGLNYANVDNSEFKIYIEKETLYLRKVEKFEIYTVQKAGIINGSCNIRSEIIVNSINKELTAVEPS